MKLHKTRKKRKKMYVSALKHVYNYTTEKRIARCIFAFVLCANAFRSTQYKTIASNKICKYHEIPERTSLWWRKNYH